MSFINQAIGKCAPTPRRIRTAQALTFMGLAACFGTASAGTFNFWGIEAKYTLSASYAAAWRLEDPNDGIINAPGRPSVPIAEELKFPESNNFDDGNRNFDKYDLVNNRGSILGDIEFSWGDFGILLRADAFYDNVYVNNNDNANTSPDTINTTQQPFNTFTDSASEFSGERARMLDAYAYGTFYFGDVMSLQLRVGKHIAAWGQSLFFNGLALSQATADATKATLPGAEVKSILLPINQTSIRFTLNDRITLLGQYQFEFKPFELNPVGEFYSVADVVGPGREFAYGIRNPFDPSVLSSFDITDQSTLAEIVMTIDEVFDGQLDSAQLQAALAGLPIGALPSLFVPNPGGNPLNAPRNLGPSYAGDINPDKDDKQYGFGIEYALTYTTTLGAYYLRYHQKTPTVLINYGELIVIPEQEIAPGITSPAITTADLGIIVPETYNIKYFDNVDLYAVGFSSLLFGWNVGGEFIRREGIDTLIDVDNGVNGPVPTPTRANSNQVILNAIYTYRPQFYFDTVVFVAEVGYTQVVDQEPVASVEGANAGQPNDTLTFDEEAWGLATLSFLEKRNIFAGWDLKIPISYQKALSGRASLAGAFGSLFGEDDTRVGVGFEFTRLNKLTLGINYSGFTGGPAHFLDRPLQDRDTVGLSLKYTVF